MEIMDHAGSTVAPDDISVKVEPFDWDDSFTNNNASDHEIGSKHFEEDVTIDAVKREDTDEVNNEPHCKKRQFEENCDNEPGMIGYTFKKVKPSVPSDAEVADVHLQSNVNTNSINLAARTHKAGDSGEFKGSGSKCFQGHTESHTGEKPLMCDECDYSCSRKVGIKRHMLVHTDEKPFSCEFCDYRCSRPENLKRHLMTHTGEKPFACDLCDYICSLPEHLKRHMMSHTGEKPFACDLCDYKCRQLVHLQVHRRIHTGEKPFACKSCDFKCIQAANLKRHMRIHTGEKPFACDSCDFSCNGPENLRRHMRMHSGEKPYACDSCDYRCRQPAHLKTHMRIHTGEKPYACDSCDYRCSFSTSLKRHMRSHTGKKPFASVNPDGKGIIEESFSGKENLNTASCINEPDNFPVKIENECSDSFALANINKHDSYSKNIEEDVTNDNDTRTETDEVINELPNHKRQLGGICDSKSGTFSGGKHVARDTDPHGGEKPFETDHMPTMPIVPPDNIAIKVEPCDCYESLINDNMNVHGVDSNLPISIDYIKKEETD